MLKRLKIDDSGLNWIAKWDRNKYNRNEGRIKGPGGKEDRIRREKRMKERKRKGNEKEDRMYRERVQLIDE